MSTCILLCVCVLTSVPLLYVPTYVPVCTVYVLCLNTCVHTAVCVLTNVHFLYIPIYLCVQYTSFVLICACLHFSLFWTVRVGMQCGFPHSTNVVCMGLVLQNKDFTVLREGLEGLFGNPSLHNLLRGECMRIIQPLRSGNSRLMHFVCLNRM